MPVGAGSIKRAAKLNADAEVKDAVKKASTTKKAVIAKETAPVKKSATAKATTKATEEKVSGNQVCHLTEELPVYLL